MVQVTWDETKCNSPQECRNCLDACSQGIFVIYPRDGRKPGIPTKNWAIRPLFASLCTGCNICQEVCPEDAITVSVSQ